jgi:replicative superfamily II helicase
MTRLKMRKLEAMHANPGAAQNIPIASLRVLALSATAPNAGDVATWLDGRVYSFDNSARSVWKEHICIIVLTFY